MSTRKGLKLRGALGYGLLMAISGNSHAVDVNALVAAEPGGQVESETAQTNGDTVVAETMEEGFQVAHQDLMNQNTDGVRTIVVGSGMGFLSTGTADYSTYDNLNATLLSKKAAFNRAAMTAKSGLLGAFSKPEIACEQISESYVETVDTGSESVGNVGQFSAEECAQEVQGSLSGYVTFDVHDDSEAKVVRVTLISTEKTRNAADTSLGGHMAGSDLQGMFNAVMTDLRKGVLPPLGGKVISVPDSNEMVVIGFGSAINRQNSNATIQRRLEGVAQNQARMRANAALLGILQGEEVYHRGEFEESQMETTEQFTNDPAIDGPEGVKKMDEERSEFLNIMRDTQSFRNAAAGNLPQGVVNRSFKSDDGYWTYALAIFSPSLSEAAGAAAAAPESGSAGESGGESGAEKEPTGLAGGGMNDSAANPQGPSGSVSDADSL